MKTTAIVVQARKELNREKKRRRVDAVKDLLEQVDRLEDMLINVKHQIDEIA